MRGCGESRIGTFGSGYPSIGAPLVGYQYTPDSVSRDRVAMQEAYLTVLRKWIDVYPEYVEKLIRRAKLSLVRKLIRAERLSGARDALFDGGLARNSLGGRIGFSVLAATCRLNKTVNRRFW